MAFTVTEDEWRKRTQNTNAANPGAQTGQQQTLLREGSKNSRVSKRKQQAHRRISRSSGTSINP